MAQLNALNFEPLQSGLNALGAAGYRNQQMALEQQQGERANAELALRQAQGGREATTFNQDQAKQLALQTGNLFESHIAPEQDPQKRAAMVSAFVNSHPSVRSTLAQHNIDPNDTEGIIKSVLDDYQQYKDPGAEAMQKAQIGKLEAEALRDRSMAENAGRGGMVPVYGVDGSGNAVVMQMTPAGELRQAKVPQGVTVDPGLTARMKAQGKETGEATGKAAVNLPLAEAAKDRIVQQIDAVNTSPGLDRVTGTVYGRLPKVTNTSKEAKEAQSRIDQIQGGTFLQAYNDLRGAGQISNAEGQAAKEAYNRLLSQELDTPSYRDALAEFRTEVLKLFDIAKQKAQGGITAPNPVPHPNSGFKYVGPAS